ncbi:hypothetical protein IWZ01DRAFT_352665 [Phyllosticta capitalensis]
MAFASRTVEMEYLYEQGGEPPRSPPPPYYSPPRQTPASRPSSLRAPRRKPEVAVYIPSGAPPKYSCEMSLNTEAPAATSRRSSVSSEATLADAVDLSDLVAAKIDRTDDSDSSTRNRSRNSSATILEDANSAVLDAEISVTAHESISDDDSSPSQSPARSTTVSRYEVLLNAHRALILACHSVNETLERELLRSRDLEISREDLRTMVEEKDRQIAARDARVKELEEKIRKQEERREEDEEKTDETEHEIDESLVQVGDRQVQHPAVEEQKHTVMLEVAEVILRFAAILLILVFPFMIVAFAMFGPAGARRP